MYIPNEHPEVDVQIQNLWQVFTIAETFGDEKTIDRYYSELMETFGKNYVMLTAFYLVTNWKLWDAWEKDHDSPIARTYDRLWQDVRQRAIDNLKGKELRFFWEVTD